LKFIKNNLKSGIFLAFFPLFVQQKIAQNGKHLITPQYKITYSSEHFKLPTFYATTSMLHHLTVISSCKKLK